MKYSRFFSFAVVAGLAASLWMQSTPVQAEEKGDRHPLNLTVGGGYLDMEGDFPTKDAVFGKVNLGYDFNDWWTIEGGLFIAPVMKAQYFYHQKADGTWEKINRLQEEAGVDQTTGFGVTLDALLHPTPWKRLDPYLAVGLQGIGFTDSMKEHDGLGLGVRGGGGVIYNINDAWGVRADYRAVFADINGKGTVSASTEVGVRYVFGANVGPNYVVAGGPKDSDADDLTDEEELKIETNPFDPDTDHDGLSDYDEVRVYHTDPLNPDTDFDGLKDGAEVFNYHTNPLLRDTDHGGVADGHEVIEDGTNPLDPNDDLQLVELNIQFDYDKDVIKAEYFKDLDIIGKVLARDTEATARIEGHADKQKKSIADYNVKLSERRAKACLNYLVTKWNIAQSRMVAVGYGFSRPKAKNDLVLGNPVNRRVEVYIRKSGKEEPKTPLTQVEVNKAGAAIPVTTP